MELISLGLNAQIGSVPLKFDAGQISGLQLWARFNSGLTETGLGVSQWDDVSGNDNHLLQAVDGSRPSLEADNSVLCDGVDEFLFATTITLSQPHTSYLLVNTKTWTAGDVILGFGGGADRSIQQSGTTPALVLHNSVILSSVSPVLDTFNVVSVVSNGASSVIQLNNDTPVTGNSGANAGTSIALGTNNQVAGFAHAAYKEVITYTGAHDATTRALVIKHLAAVGGLSI